MFLLTPVFLMIHGQPAVADVTTEAGLRPVDCVRCEITADPNKPLKDFKSSMDTLKDKLCAPLSSEKPKSGTRTLLKSVKFGITGISKMNDLVKSAQSSLDQAEKAQTGCPEGCGRQNKARIEITTTPTKFTVHPSCPKTYSALSFTSDETQGMGVTVSKGDLGIRFSGQGKSCHDQANQWFRSVLDGNNRLGDFINKTKCPDPCSVASSLVLEDIGRNDRCDLQVRLVMRCGPPRASFLNAEWKSDATLVNDWTCQSPKGAP